MSQHPFQLFINLVTFDQETRSLQHEVENDEKKIQELQSQLRKLNQEVEQKKEVVVDLRKKVDNSELEMKTLDTQEADKKKRLDEVSGHKEYTSIKTEIDRVQRAQVEQEQAVINAWNKLETAQQEMEKFQKEFEIESSRLQKEIEQLSQKITQLQEDITKRVDGRAEKLTQVPEEWLSKYEMMQSRVADPVVPIDNGSCTSCFTVVTDSDLQRIGKGAILQCKMCYRLLYSPEVMKNGN